MRSSSRSFGPAILLALFAVVPMAAFAEDAEFDKSTTEGQQFVPAGAAPDTHSTAKNLNTVPDDNLGLPAAAGGDNPLVKRLLAARPNEDLVICIAGCFSGRDRVVYAQPSIRVIKTTQATLRPASMDDAAIAETPTPEAMSTKAAAVDPGSPTIINRTN